MSLPGGERVVQNPMIEYTTEVDREHLSPDEAQIKFARHWHYSAVI
jgi:hypothetical protein